MNKFKTNGVVGFLQIDKDNTIKMPLAPNSKFPYYINITNNWANVYHFKKKDLRYLKEGFNDMNNWEFVKNTNFVSKFKNSHEQKLIFIAKANAYAEFNYHPKLSKKLKDKFKKFENYWSESDKYIKISKEGNNIRIPKNLNKTNKQLSIWDRLDNEKNYNKCYSLWIEYIEKYLDKKWKYYKIYKMASVHNSYLIDANEGFHELEQNVQLFQKEYWEINRENMLRIFDNYYNSEDYWEYIKSQYEKWKKRLTEVRERMGKIEKPKFKIKNPLGFMKKTLLFWKPFWKFQKTEFWYEEFLENWFKIAYDINGKILFEWIKYKSIEKTKFKYFYKEFIKGYNLLQDFGFISFTYDKKYKLFDGKEWHAIKKLKEWGYKICCYGEDNYSPGCYYYEKDCKTSKFYYTEFNYSEKNYIQEFHYDKLNQ